MIGKTFRHSMSGITGIVDAQTEHPDGRSLCRVNDHWFFADECE